MPKTFSTIVSRFSISFFRITAVLNSSVKSKINTLPQWKEYSIKKDEVSSLRRNLGGQNKPKADDIFLDIPKAKISLPLNIWLEFLRQRMVLYLSICRRVFENKFFDCCTINKSSMRSLKTRKKQLLILFYRC